MSGFNFKTFTKYVTIVAFLLSFYSCKDESVLPSVATTDITSITSNEATGGGTITNDGGESITSRGVCWSATQNPSITDNFTSDGNGGGTYVSIITNLLPGNTYHVRAYATNSVGTAYGQDITFTTSSIAPSVTTLPITSITASSATGGGTVSDEGGSNVTAKGLCWSTSQNPTIANSFTNDGEGTGEFSSSISELFPGVAYHVRAYATNSVETAYGDNIQFTTLATLPSITSTTITSITSSTALGGGNITSDGGAAITSRGVCWSTSENPTTSDSKTINGDGLGVFESSIAGLSAGETYNVRAYAVNSVGTAYGENLVFTTSPLPTTLPTVSTVSVTSINYNSAVCGGNITSDGGAAITSRGVCWSPTENPTTANNITTNGNGIGAFASNLNGLTELTTYYVRAYAINSAGTAYGENVQFTTLVNVVDNSHMLLGNPDGATTSIVTANNYLMVKPQYCLSYSNAKLTANWASWHLYSGDIGDVERQDDFRADNTLPSSWYWVGSTAYSGSGFDKGHLCPSADRTLTIPDNSATFLMTNMIPQAPNNNRITWANLEDYCRSLLSSGNELYIVAGPHGQGGIGSNGAANTVGNGIVVPSKTWKIIVVIPNGNNDLNRISTTTRVIAVIMPNEQTCSSQPWTYYKVSVDYIESLTGYDFLSNVPVSIQQVIEVNVDN